MSEWQRLLNTWAYEHVAGSGHFAEYRTHKPDPSVDAEVKVELVDGISTTYTFEPDRVETFLVVGCATCGHPVNVGLGSDPFGTALRGVLAVEDRERA